VKSRQLRCGVGIRKPNGYTILLISVISSYGSRGTFFPLRANKFIFIVNCMLCHALGYNRIAPCAGSQGLG
jgi:hypothetical protein